MKPSCPISVRFGGKADSGSDQGGGKRRSFGDIDFPKT